MNSVPKCPKCGCEYAYEDRENYVCPECTHEWLIASENQHVDTNTIKDAFGNILADGDSVSNIKDLKIKGSSSVVKVGTKVKNIRLNYDGDHNIDCKIDGIGSMGLKSEFVKKI